MYVDYTIKIKVEHNNLRSIRVRYVEHSVGADETGRQAPDPKFKSEVRSHPTARHPMDAIRDAIETGEDFVTTNLFT
jgi:hypothetical protein